MRYLVAVVACLLAVTGFTQDSLRGKVLVSLITEKNEPIENVTVELLSAADSSLKKISLTDKKGKVEFDRIRFGSYLLKTSLTNYAMTFSKPFTLSAETNPVQLPAITLLPKSTQMSEVIVTAKKPFIQKLNDRIVVNVESSLVSAGSSAMDILERSPGITIDQNDALSLRGRQGVIIMIDGKPSQLSGADLGQLPSWSSFQRY